MLEIMGAIFNAIWQLLSIPFVIDGISINTWQVILFVAFLAVAVNGIWGKAGGNT